MELAGKTFAVTGGGNGIGRQVTLRLLDRGAKVAAVDLNVEGLEATAAQAADRSRVSLHSVDITDREAVAALPAAVIAAHGTVDGLINVAGIVHRFARVQDLTFEEMEKVLAVNYWGVVNTSKAFLPHLLDRPRAALVNVASMGALAPVPGQSAYGASKAAVKLLTEGLYAELRGTNVAVTAVFPGGVGTDILGNSGVAMVRDEKSSGTGAKLTSPADAAEQIIEGMRRGRFRVRIGADARLLDRLSRLMPQRATALIADKMKHLLDG